MATYAIAAGEVGAYEKTLTAATVDTVTFAYEAEEVVIYSNGSAAITYSVDGSTPTALGAGFFYIPAQTSVTKVNPERQPGATPTVVKLISAGTPQYSVWRGDY